MADTKVSALTEATSATTNDLFYIVDEGTTSKKITFPNLNASIDHTAVANKGTNTHAQIDTHIANTANPHSVTKTQVGLGNVADIAQVTSVTGTAPVVSSGGTTPAISMAAATTSVNGYLTSTDWNTFNGKVTSVGATSPVASSGGATPTISMPAAATAQNGYLTSTDWNTFNGKVTSVSGSAPVVSSGGTTPAISMAAATTSVNGYLTSTDWNTFNGKVGASDTATLTNKRITKRVVTVSDATSITPNADTTDVCYQANTQAVGTLTVNAPSGTPTDGQPLLIRLKSTNIQTFSWNAIYNASTTNTLPTASTGSSKYDYFSFIYNSISSKWDLTGKDQGH